jgi:hypothetical protein
VPRDSARRAEGTWRSMRAPRSQRSALAFQAAPSPCCYERTGSCASDWVRNRCSTCSAVPTWRRGTGRGFPVTRRDSTIRSYGCRPTLTVWLLTLLVWIPEETQHVNPLFLPYSL